MKYKVSKGSDTFNKVTDLITRAQEANKACFEFAKRKFNCERLIFDHGNLGGSICGFELDNKPEGWSVASRHHRGIYFPQARLKVNKELLAEIAALPQVTTEEYINLIGFKPQFKGRIYYRSIACFEIDDCILFDVPNECDYEPLPDMVEIFESEFVRLTKEVNND